MLDCFGDVFEEPETYGAHRPANDYVHELLRDPGFVGLVARVNASVTGALCA
jgi:aminoglycoside 3-N-acetyltransferase I